MKRTNLAYCAGIIDGEGCLSILERKTPQGNKSYELRVQVVNTNEWLCQWLKFAFGGSVSKMKLQASQRKQAWQWTIAARQALGLLELVEPFLHIKQPEAQVAIRFQRAKMPTTRKRTLGELAIEEAEKILLHNYKR